MVKEKPKKNVWVAIILSILLVGLGHIYNKRYKQAAIYFFGILIVLPMISAFLTGFFSALFPSDGVAFLFSFLTGIVFLSSWAYSAYDAYKITKDTVHEEPNRWAYALVIIVITIGMIVGLMAAWSTSFTASQNSIATEYNAHRTLVNNDLQLMSGLYNNWTYVYNDAIADNQLTNAETARIGDAINEYSLQYRIVNQHLASFKAFVLKNEKELQSLDVDTFQTETQIDDASIGMQNNIDRMKYYTQNLADAYQQQREQLLNYLKLLTVLA